MMNKEIDYEALTALAFEIEGLAMLMRERGEDCPVEVEQLLASKARQLAAYFDDAPAEPVETVATVETIEPVALPTIEEKEAPAESPEEPAEEEMAETEETVDEGPLEVPTFEQIGYEREPIRLDEKLARDGARDLRKAFTLNDRFRFRRELFGNSENRMVEAIDIIDAMNSYEEAEEYFYGDLGWDSESDDVKDFMAIVAKHFNSGE